MPENALPSRPRQTPDGESIFRIGEGTGRLRIRVAGP